MDIFPNCANIEFKPYDRYGSPIKGLHWKIVSFDETNNIGSFFLKFDKHSKTNYHQHTACEEFFILEGSLIDSYGNVFNKGTFVSMKPGSEHFTYTEEGCIVLVFSYGKNNVKAN